MELDSRKRCTGRNQLLPLLDFLNASQCIYEGAPDWRNAPGNRRPGALLCIRYDIPVNNKMTSASVVHTGRKRRKGHAMTEATQDATADTVPVLYDVTIGKRPNGTHWVGLSITLNKIGTFSTVMPPSAARLLGPQLAKELASAADIADAEDRKQEGLVIAHGLPDSLQKGH